MLTDCVESASRTLSDPAPGSLRKLVRDLTMKRLLDGQLEESGLTLTDLHLIEESLVKGLTALYHSRIKYPDARERRAA
jgi:membrane-associated HD superfamily phosphohydrolase